jgi:phospholipid/cholesterol/gamma-HCH transport system permease protein
MTPPTLTIELAAAEDAGPSRLLLRGALDAAAGRMLLSVCRKRLASRAPVLRLDLGEVERFDLGGVALVQHVALEAERHGTRLELRRPSAELQRALESLPLPAAPTEGNPARPRFLVAVGEASAAAFAGALRAADFAAESLLWLLWPPRGQRRLRPGLVAEQVLITGADAVLIVVLINFLVGAIMGLQSAYQLRQFGAEIFVANLVGVAMTRELGPLVAAIIVAGRSGSAIAAELGTMRVSEEIDALRALGVSATGLLVVPRLAALALALPCLALLADVAGVLGGLSVGVLVLDLPVAAYWNQTLAALSLADVLTGLFKASVFGATIALVGCHAGLAVTGGAAGVGRAATAAVVASIFLTILLDSLFTALFYALGT